MDKESTSLIAILDDLDARYEEIKQISDPAIAMETAKLVALSKERGKIRPMVSKYRDYRKMVAGIDEARQILETSGRP